MSENLGRRKEDFGQMICRRGQSSSYKTYPPGPHRWCKWGPWKRRILVKLGFKVSRALAMRTGRSAHSENSKGMVALVVGLGFTTHAVLFHHHGLGHGRLDLSVSVSVFSHPTVVACGSTLQRLAWWQLCLAVFCQKMIEKTVTQLPIFPGLGASQSRCISKDDFQELGLYATGILCCAHSLVCGTVRGLSQG